MGLFEASRGTWITCDVFGAVDKVMHSRGLLRSPLGLRSDLLPGFPVASLGTVRKMGQSGRWGSP